MLPTLPSDPDFGLALSEQEAGHSAAARAAYQRLLSRYPDHWLALANLGALELGCGRVSAAVDALHRSLVLCSGQYETWHQLGLALQAQGQLDAAKAAFSRAILLNPEFAESHVGLAHLVLAQGDWVQGWAEYEWRLNLPSCCALGAEYAAPRWPGDVSDGSLQGKRLLLCSEGSVGDILQFCRYVPELESSGATVVLHVPPSLASLLKSVSRRVEVAVKGACQEDLPQYDFYCPLLSLPYHLQITPENVPAKVPYLAPHGEVLARWRQRLGATERIRVGLCWGISAGGLPPNPLLPSALKPLLELDCELHCLQAVGPSEVEWLNVLLDDGVQVRTYTEAFANWEELAALVAGLDVVISVDSDVVHLAGALGRPVWVLLEEQPHFRWLQARSDSPWYPTARLFRRNPNTDWDTVIQQVRTALAALC